MNPINSPSPGNVPASGSAADELTDRLQDDKTAVVEAAKQDLQSLTDKAAADVRDLKDQAEQQVSAVTDKAKSFANEQKDLLASQVNGVADAIAKVADELDQSDQQSVARYARDLAGGLSRFGRNVEGKDVDEVMGMAQSFGRQQPLAFLGAAALAGFMASRFAQASAHHSQSINTANSGATGGQSATTRQSWEVNDG
jgi:hypothetical protein